MSSASPSVAILVLNWNGWRDTVECLESLFRGTYSGFQVIVCDNGSHDDSLNHIAAWAQSAGMSHVLYDRSHAEAGGVFADESPLVLIQTGANLGFAGGNNVGLRYCLARGGFDYVWVLNNDTVVAPDALHHLVARMQQDKAVGMCGSKLVFYHQRDRVQAYGGSAFNAARGVVVPIGQFAHVDAVCDVAAVEAQTAYVVGASMLVSMPFLKSVGLMCEDYFLYFEEIDWAFRARGQFKLAYADASVVWHKEGGSIGSSSTQEPSAISTRYLYRNRVIFNWRYNRANFARSMVRVAFELLVLLKRRQFKTMRVALTATLAGLGVLRRTGEHYAG